MDTFPRRAALISVASAVAAPLALSPAAPAVVARAQASTLTDRVRRRPLFGAVQWQLPNGLRVVLAESRRAPVAAHYLYLGAGAGEDPAGRSGVAHFLEHFMFKGSPAVPSGAFSRVVAQEGGQDNAFTSRDVTAYFQTVEASRLPLMMRMEADRFAAPVLPADEVEPERGVIVEERRQRTDAVPRGRFREAFDAAMWGPQHWRGRPLIGWLDEIRAITRDDMAAFHARHYAPSNAILVVAGDVREADLRRWADEFYAPVPARPAPGRDRAPPPSQAAEPRIVRRDPTVREASFVRALAAPSATWAGFGGTPVMADPLDAVAHLLGGGPGSRLHAALVESGLCVSAGADYDGESYGVGTFGVFATPRPGVTPERVEETIDATLARLLDEGATEAEVARSVRQMTAGALLALDGLGAAPRMIGGALAIGLPLEDVEHWPERMAAVTRDQVNEAARAVLGGRHLETTGWLLPA
ncbi:MAG: insulinase family protein [Acetobacteraceae bacterium]|nr:insulinase family protein [Acetobacteraceae bacterium]